MKIRRDVVFVSAVLFTVALLCALPTFTRTALEGYSSMSEAQHLCCGLYLRTMGDLGVASLAIIFIALIVTRAGYAKCLRSAWFIMFAVVWIWAFPLLALPLFKRASALTFVEVLYGALHGYQYPRIWLKAILIFSLMVIALLLPIKSFLVSGGIREPSRSLSPRLIGFSVAGALVIAIALLAWIDFRAYEIPSAWLNNGQQLVGIDIPLSPPPPPSRARAPAEDWLSCRCQAKLRARLPVWISRRQARRMFVLRGKIDGVLAPPTGATCEATGTGLPDESALSCRPVFQRLCGQDHELLHEVSTRSRGRGLEYFGCDGHASGPY